MPTMHPCATKNCIFEICIATIAVIPVVFPDYAVTQSKNDIKQHNPLCVGVVTVLHCTTSVNVPQVQSTVGK